MADTERDLLRPDLWDLLLPALKAARRAGREYEGRGKYVPRQSVTKYRGNDAGWPQTTENTLGSGADDGPINWPEMFGPDPGLLTRIPVSDVPCRIRNANGSPLVPAEATGQEAEGDAGAGSYSAEADAFEPEHAARVQPPHCHSPRPGPARERSVPTFPGRDRSCTRRSLMPSTLLPPPMAILYGLLKRWAVRSASDRRRRVPVVRAGMVESRATPSTVDAAVV